MKAQKVIIILSGLVVFPLSSFAENTSSRPIVRVNCNAATSLQWAIDRAEEGAVISVIGNCLGGITIARDRLTIKGGGASGVLDGQGKDVITIQGARNITLENIEVRNGRNGIVANGGAHVAIDNTAVHDNAQIGILLESNSSAVLSGGSSKHNGFNGVDLEGSSSLFIAGSYAVESNAVFGMNINTSSSLTLTQASLNVSGNTLGIQIATSSGAFISDSATTIDVNNNLTTGLTIVSGGHMVAFGGTITSQNNGVHGISVDSKAGLDLDAAALVESHDNVGDGVHLEENSVMTMFNTTAFSGAPGVTTLKAYNNGANGISVLTGSNVTMIHQASISSTNNHGVGVAADSGSALTLIQSVITGNQKDLLLSFGSRADLMGNTIGSVSCDASVLMRGNSGVVCPK